MAYTQKKEVANPKHYHMLYRQMQKKPKFHGRPQAVVSGTCFGVWYVRGKLTGLGGICLGAALWLISYPFAAFNKPSTSDSSNALTDASIMLVETPIVVHMRSPFVASISTRVIAPVAKPESSIRTL